MNFSEKAYVNLCVIRCHVVIDLVLFIAYAVEWLKGARSLAYVGITAVFAFLPIIIESIIYKRNPEGTVIRHCVGVGYSMLYVFLLLTASSDYAYVYAFPMFAVITLYLDAWYCAAICGGCSLLNIALVAYQAVTVGYDTEQIKDVEIRIAVLLVVTGFAMATTISNRKINSIKKQRIEEQQDTAKSLITELLTTSEHMSVNIKEAAEKMALLGESEEQIHESMNQVSIGSNETAESVQHQLQQTEQIQNYIGNVKDTTIAIEQNMVENARRVEEGREQMQILAEQVDKSMHANEQVIQQMDMLKEYTEQMNTIIETITSIAGSTGMLALNASIEAARAGEAGRGFAVVASQISGLANQTKEATVNITSLIENINGEIQSVANAVDVVSESNRANTDSALIVTNSFEGIADGTENISKQAKELIDVVNNLEVANGDIVEKIQTISAITEEVSAHASETYSACEENKRMLDAVNQVVTNLEADAEKLKSIK